MPSFQSASPVRKLESLLSTRHLSFDEIHSLFRKADLFSKHYGSASQATKIVACLFLEASTRTRISFQIATQRLGHQFVVIDAGTSTSMSKGETDVDTVLNIAAMRPDALVIRYNQSAGLDALLPTLPMPVISAGTGVEAHPTQALLDAYTIEKELGGVRGQRVLIVGDIIHSRVARSNFDVLRKLGAEIAVCGPEALMPVKGEIADLKVFNDLDEALAWPTVYMGLRIQKERHENSEISLIAEPLSHFHQDFALTANRLKLLPRNAIIMHPEKPTKECFAADTRAPGKLFSIRLMPDTKKLQPIRRISGKSLL